MLVLTYGTFDLFHYGHIRLLERARALGSSLGVGLSTDEFNAVKNKKAFMSYAERAALLSTCRFVDFVFPESNWEQKATDIVHYRAGVLVMGDDWQGKFDFLNDICQVVYLPRTPSVSTTAIIEHIVGNS